jgi:hypothetical protein
MSIENLKSPGFMVHEKLKDMVKRYGVMMTAVPAELIGEMQAERSLVDIDKTGNINQKIVAEVSISSKDMTEPANSCGQASNDVCELLLGKIEAAKFQCTDYEELSTNGDNLKCALNNTNLLIRFEIDRANYPNVLIKTKSENFNASTASRNKIYLLENKLCFLDRQGNLFDLIENEKKCRQLFNTMGSLREYSLCDPFILDEPESFEDFAICDIAKIFNEQKHRFDCWLGSHSFIIFAPQELNNAPQKLYPYQAYFGSHTLQGWFLSDKDEYLSQIGSEAYIEKLTLLGTTTNNKERSDVYAELFSKRGRENLFCAHLNEKTEQLRVKFKVAEVTPKKALKNLEEVHNFIKTYSGESASDQVESYKNRAKIAMTQQLESLLQIKPELNQYSFWKNNKESVQDTTISYGQFISSQN